jgi:hypothetical protein
MKDGARVDCRGAKDRSYVSAGSPPGSAPLRHPGSVIALQGLEAFSGGDEQGGVGPLPHIQETRCWGNRPRTGDRGSGGLDRVDALHGACLQPFGFDDLESGGLDEG